MYFIVYYELVDNYLEAREALRPQHFEHVQAALERGEFIMGGALETLEEAVLIFKVESQTTVEDFIRKDPYVIGGVVMGYRIRKWKVAVGG